jgi:hypothetical protein
MSALAEEYLATLQFERCGDIAVAGTNWHFAPSSRLGRETFGANVAGLRG